MEKKNGNCYLGFRAFRYRVEGLGLRSCDLDYLLGFSGA